MRRKLLAVKRLQQCEQCPNEWQPFELLPQLFKKVVDAVAKWHLVDWAQFQLGHKKEAAVK